MKNNILNMHYPNANKLIHKDEFHITNEDGQLIATLPNYENDLTFSEANAKLIVKAVNNHEKLIEALKAAKNIIFENHDVEWWSKYKEQVAEISTLIQSIEQQ